MGYYKNYLINQGIDFEQLQKQQFENHLFNWLYEIDIFTIELQHEKEYIQSCLTRAEKDPENKPTSIK